MDLKNLSKGFVKSILKCLSPFFKIKNNRIVFRSYNGSRYNCSPKYISEYLIKNYKGKMEIVWMLKAPEKYSYLAEKGILLCKADSLKAIYYMMSAKFLVDNNGIPEFLPVKKNQITINTWHGGGSYKKRHVDPKSIKDVQNITKYISSCRRFSQMNLINCYNLQEDHIFEIGLPRNDIFFTDDPSLKRKVKKALHVPEDKKMILFAPTYREYSKDDEILNVDRMISTCEKRFGGEFVFATRCHQYDKQKLQTVSDRDIIDTDFYDDLQEVIYACDVLITDYSSIMWDVSFTDSPCFIYATDIDEYLDNRGFYTPIQEWPFPIAKNMDELENNISSFDSEDYKAKVDAHHKALGSFETGTAGKKAAEYIISNI